MDFVTIDESRQLGINILTGKPNLDEYYVFIDWDYDKLKEHIKTRIIENEEIKGDEVKIKKAFDKLKKNVEELHKGLNEAKATKLSYTEGEGENEVKKDYPEQFTMLDD